MAVQIVQYIDLRHTIDVNPPTYHYVPYKDEVLELQNQLAVTEHDAHEANDMSEELKAKLLELQLEQQLREKTTEKTDIPISRESSAKLSVCLCTEIF
ncbi:hypothetical protein ACF0H5_024157 [Mactra antiquata]